MRLAAAIRSVDAIDILALEGEIDFGTSDRFGDLLQMLLYDRAGEVLVDMRRVAFMDSTGVRQLVATRRRLGLQGRHLAVVCAAGPVHDVFETAGLLQELDVHQTRPGAERALS
jgi:anti-sigma B factor antagonist